MGKRELLLIVAFVAVGAVVYQLTAPANQPGDSIVSAGGRILEEIRREVRGRPADAEITATATHPVPAGIHELRVTLRNTPVMVSGEDRDDIATELWVRSNGVDEAEAKALAEKVELTVEPAGPTITVSMTYPEEGRQQGKLHLKVPSGMLVQFGPTNTQVEVSGVERVDLESARGETIIRKIEGQVSVTHRGGELTVEDVGSVRLNTRGSELRLAGVEGDTALEIQSGDVRAERLLGPVDITAQNGDITLEHLQDTPGPLRITMTEGSLTVRGLRAEARIDTNRTDTYITMDEAAAVAIFSTDARIELTPPRDGFTLDAIAAGGDITLPDSLTHAISVTGKSAGEDKEQRAAGDVRDGGPTITLRAKRGDIRIKARESN